VITVDCPQYSDEWNSARLGLPTASAFSKIICPTGGPSKQADAYANLLIAEIMTGKPIAEIDEDHWNGNEHTERGKELEASAAAFYELQTGVEAKTVGFCTDDARTMGCSPDRIIGADGLLELKCPAPHTHIQYLLDQKIDQKYRPQTQGQLLVTGRKWVDLVSYHPELPPVIIRVGREETYLSEMATLLKQFNAKLQDKLARLTKLGYREAA
jgi:hypothetical protein